MTNESPPPTEYPPSTSDDVPRSYEAASAELSRIVAELESGDVDVDDLAKAVSRATALIRHCRQRLRTVETELDEALTGLDSDPDAA